MLSKLKLFSSVPGQRVGADPVGHLAAQLNNLRVTVTIANVLQEELELAGALLSLFLGRSTDNLVQADGNGNRAVDDISDSDEVVLGESSAGHCRSSHAEAARDKGRTITGDCVLVGCDTDQLQNALHTASVNAVGLQIREDQVVVSTTADKAVAEATLALVITEALGECLCVGENLRLVGMEIWSLGLLQCHGKGSDGVVMRTALVAREHGVVDGALEVVHLILLGLGVLSANTLAEEDQSATGSAQALVAGGGDDISMLERTGKDLGRNKAGDVGHIRQHIRANLVADITDALVVDQSAVGTRAGNNDLGTVKQGELLELLIVNEARLLVQAVRDSLEVLGNGRNLLCRCLVAVREMASVRQIESHESVVGIHESRINI